LIENCGLALKSSACRVIGVSPWWLTTSSNIWPKGRETKIAQLTGKTVGTLLDVSKVAEFIHSLTELPKNMEISEVIINRK
jgi:NADP-dependent 3-hydroxy acid dehydrogenase YdfG